MNCETCGKEMLARNLKRHMFTHLQHQLARVDCDEAGCQWRGADILQLRRHYRKVHRLAPNFVRQRLHSFKMRSLVRENGGDTVLLKVSKCHKKKKKKIGFGAVAEDLPVADQRPLRLLRKVPVTRAFDCPVLTESEVASNHKEKTTVKMHPPSPPPRQQTEEVRLRVDALLADFRSLTPSQRVGSNDRRHSPAQLEILHRVFRLSRYPTETQRTLLSEKTGLPMKKIHYWFDNNRRKMLARPEGGGENKSRGCGANNPTYQVKKDSSSGSSGSDTESESDEEKLDNPGIQLVEEMVASGQAVCVGWEVNDSCAQCTLCSYSCPIRGNLYKHITAHGVTAFKFCSKESPLLPEGNRGCRRIFAASTFSSHTCSATDVPQLGEFPLLHKTRSKKKLEKKKRRKERKLVSEASGDAKIRFGVPDGSPAKFYSERYAKLFQQLEAKHVADEGGGAAELPMDAMFMRNGKVELVYLTAWQMQAVREFAGGSDKYFLVRSSGWTDRLNNAAHCENIINVLQAVLCW